YDIEGVLIGHEEHVPVVRQPNGPLAKVRDLLVVLGPERICEDPGPRRSDVADLPDELFTVLRPRVHDEIAGRPAQNQLLLLLVGTTIRIEYDDVAVVR